MRRFRGVLFLMMGLFFLPACEPETTSSCANDYDQGTLFTRLADDLIIPAYADSKNEVASLNASWTAFSQSGTSSDLLNVQNDFKSAYEAFVKVEYFEFGPAEDVALRTSLNNFPANTLLIEANISSGTYDLEAPDNYYAGFPALDYLLFSGTENEILDRFNNANSGDAFRTYVSGILGIMVTKLDAVNSGWDSYRGNFISNTGTAAGTSLSLIINALNENFEKTKRDRLGIPAGLTALNAPPVPQNVEAFHSGHSLVLMKESFSFAKEFFRNGNGEGLDNFLDDINALGSNGQSLTSVINGGFDDINSSVNLLPEPLSDAVINNEDLVTQAFSDASRQVVHIKTDMPTMLCVAITYIDNPSDSD